MKGSNKRQRLPKNWLLRMGAEGHATKYVITPGEKFICYSMFGIFLDGQMSYMNFSPGVITSYGTFGHQGKSQTLNKAQSRKKEEKVYGIAVHK